MSTETTVLIIDASPEDRAAVRSVLDERVTQFIEANDAAEAWGLTRDIGQVSLMIAGLSAETGVDILDFRDHLQGEIGLFPCVFSSHQDMTPFYERVFENERLFFKPVNRGALIEWFEQSVNQEIPAGEPREAFAASTQEPVGSPPPENRYRAERRASRRTAASGGVRGGFTSGRCTSCRDAPGGLQVASGDSRKMTIFAL